jgi:hypothetical protein
VRPFHLLLAAGLCLALKLGWVLSQGPPDLVGDMLDYQAYSRSIASGTYSGLDGLRAGRMPGYPAFLAAVRLVFGPSIRAVLLSQCLLCALMIPLLFLAAEGLLEPPWPLACASAAAIFHDFSLAAARPLTECLFAFLLCAALAGLHRRRVLLAAAAFAAAFLVRPEVMPFAALILAAGPWLLKLGRRQALAGLGGLALCAAAWTARNYAVLGAAAPSTSTGASALYMGLRHPAESLFLRTDARFAPSSDLPEARMNEAFREAYAGLRRSLGIKNTLKCYAYNLASLFYPFLPAYDWTFAFVVPFWLLGLRAAGNKPGWWPCAGLSLGLPMIYVFFGGPASRYRFGFAPALLLLAALGGKEAFERLGRRNFACLAGGWLLLNIGIWLAGPSARGFVLGLRAFLI